MSRYIYICVPAKCLLKQQNTMLEKSRASRSVFTDRVYLPSGYLLSHALRTHELLNVDPELPVVGTNSVRPNVYRDCTNDAGCSIASPATSSNGFRAATDS